MSLGILNTPPNQALAATVTRRMVSDTRRSAALSTMYRCLGVGGCLLLLGGGLGLAFYGWSYVSDNRTSMDKLASAMAEALDKVQLKGNVTVDGSVPLDTAGATVGLDANGARVKLDSSGATVKLDSSGATVATAPTMRPNEQQLQQKALPASRAETVTNYTIFKHVDYGGGEVVTGWRFQSSSDLTPFHQYCYYSPKASETVTAAQYVSTQYILALNHEPTTVKGLPIDPRAGLANCVWFEPAAIPSIPALDGPRKRA